MWYEQCSLEVGTAGFAGTYSPPNAGAPGGCRPTTLEVYVEWAVVSRKMPQGALHVCMDFDHPLVSPLCETLATQGAAWFCWFF